MKASLRIATIVAGVLAVCISALVLQAQDPRGGRPAPSRGTAVPPNIAVVDISLIFKNHSRFQRMMDKMKEDVKAAEVKVRQEHKELTDLSKKLRTFKPGSPDYNRIEEDIARRQAALKIDMQIQRKEFRDQEAKIFHQIYKEVAKQVKYFAQQHGISLVLRYNSSKIDPDKPGAIHAGVNNPVVFQDNIDITGDIIKRLNRGAPPPRTGRKQPSRSTIPRGNVPRR